MTKTFAPRIHVLLANKAPLGVVIRRGPSKSVATLLWDRRTDKFQMGQWLRGRIYERRSDLSPDGRHIIYFAMNGKWNSETKGAWTAISVAPYLKAVALYAKGDCWHGGGLWTGPRSYWLNDGYGHTQLKTSSSFQRDTRYSPEGACGGECLGVYFPRLLRDGWSMHELSAVEYWKGLTVFKKPLHSGWILRKLTHAGIHHPPGKGCYWDEHELSHLESGRTIEFPNWEWADIDGSRLVWAADGRLWAGHVDRSGLIETTELYDFREMKFTSIRAPY